MPEYIVNGVGISTNRKRRKIYKAYDEDSVRKIAFDDGTDVESIEIVPPSKPSQAQLDYANGLGLEIPADANAVEVSDLLSYAENEDHPIDDLCCELAFYYKIEITRFIGRITLYNRIFNSLLSGNLQEELIKFYVINAYRDMLKQNGQNDFVRIDDEKIIHCANEMALDPGSLNSIKRMEGDELIRFGEWTTKEGYAKQGGSRRTKAYKSVRQFMGISVRKIEKHAEAPKQHIHQYSSIQTTQRVAKAQGCAGIFAMALILPFGIAAAYFI